MKASAIINRGGEPRHGRQSHPNPYEGGNAMQRMIRVISLALVLAVFCPQQAGAEYGVFQPSEFARSKPGVVLVPWNSEQGRQRFARARYKQDFFQLAQTYQPQINPLYCGIASSVIVLNALRLAKGTVPSQAELQVPAPPQFGGGEIPFRSYSQLTFLNADTERVKPRQVIELKNAGQGSAAISPGLVLAELQAMLGVYHADAQLRYADDDNLARGTASFRKAAKAVLGDTRRFLVVNFKGSTLGAATGGHISPVGAYDAASDSALLLDVAGHKNPWYWVPLQYLYQAMHTKDGEHYRGYLVVSDPE
jgi:hypothetical protein